MLVSTKTALLPSLFSLMSPIDFIFSRSVTFIGSLPAPGRMASLAPGWAPAITVRKKEQEKDQVGYFSHALVL